ncbi:MAG: hypothetical protein ABSC41_16490 [Acidimicrobiales bacterium]|jgi:hypothetical protein
MSSYDPPFGSHRPTVRLVNQSGSASPTYRNSGGRLAKKSGASTTRWIVRSIMFATTAFALFDLVLLATSGHS